MNGFSKSEYEELSQKLADGDRFALSRCLTFAESTLGDHQKLIQKILSTLPDANTETLRIAVSGSPGVGKSTFIEKFGLFLIEQGKKVAVLAIDPSSSISHGSILGDKTRMQELSRHPNAFVRPTPAGTSLGGVGGHTKESIHLCEANGYDVILIETVGVGQSEYYVSKMVDFFLLLVLPGAGDSLQGIKRGIVEVADLIAINKADGNRIELALQTYRQYKQALHLFAPKENGWVTEVIQISALEAVGMDEIWKSIQLFWNTMGKEKVNHNRGEQDNAWLSQKLKAWIVEKYLSKHIDEHKMDKILDKLKDQELTVFEGLESLKKEFN